MENRNRNHLTNRLSSTEEKATIHQRIHLAVHVKAEWHFITHTIQSKVRKTEHTCAHKYKIMKQETNSRASAMSGEHLSSHRMSYTPRCYRVIVLSCYNMHSPSQRHQRHVFYEEKHVAGEKGRKISLSFLHAVAFKAAVQVCRKTSYILVARHSLQ